MVEIYKLSYKHWYKQYIAMYVYAYNNAIKIGIHH